MLKELYSLAITKKGAQSIIGIFKKYCPEMLFERQMLYMVIDNFIGYVGSGVINQGLVSVFIYFFLKKGPSNHTYYCDKYIKYFPFSGHGHAQAILFHCYPLLSDKLIIFYHLGLLRPVKKLSVITHGGYLATVLMRSWPVFFFYVRKTRNNSLNKINKEAPNGEIMGVKYPLYHASNPNFHFKLITYMVECRMALEHYYYDVQFYQLVHFYVTLLTLITIILIDPISGIKTISQEIYQQCLETCHSGKISFFAPCIKPEKYLYISC
ncbi:hypothetical protein BDC45DRAFT_534070 [Circinella umbellata]|nr:hypothetical protein BDC45DRAFT_534070 [Circinella umbellata]